MSRHGGINPDGQVFVWPMPRAGSLSVPPSAADVERAQEWAREQAGKPWPGLTVDRGNPLFRAARRARVQSWREARPVVVTVRQNRHGYFRGWWDVECRGESRRAFEPHQHLDACDYARRLAELVCSERPADTEEPPNA